MRVFHLTECTLIIGFLAMTKAGTRTVLNLTMYSEQAQTLSQPSQASHAQRHRICKEVPSPARLHSMLKRYETRHSNLTTSYTLVNPEDLKLRFSARTNDCPQNETQKQDSNIERIRSATSA